MFVEANDPDAVWVPERLFQRLTAVAKAYELHLAPLLGGPDPVELNRQQIDLLLQEMAYVASCLRNDQLVGGQVALLSGYLGSVLARPDGSGVTVEGG